MTLDRYLARRCYWEVAFWSLYLLIAFTANVGVIWIDNARSGSETLRWEVMVWEATSLASTALLIPAVLAFDRRFPVRLDTLKSSLPAHALFTVVFSLMHVTMMYWGRVGIYKLHGTNDGYYWPDWWVDFSYEYLKDFRTYILVLLIVYLYRFIVRRLQGEAGFVADGPGDHAPPKNDRFLIKKLGREFLVNASDIDWIESSGNYVNLHVDKRVYPLRETMSGISERLAPLGFLRVHRRAVVNLDRVSEIQVFDTGDGEISLASSSRVPMSRRYRKDLRARLS